MIPQHLSISAQLQRWTGLALLIATSALTGHAASMEAFADPARMNGSNSPENFDKLPATELTALGAQHEHGEGVPRDSAKAMTLYCLAARKGFASAQYALGWMYANGRGMPKDDGLARHFFELAAKQGHAQAQEMLRLVAAETTPIMPACLQPEAVVTEPPPATYPKGPIYHLVHKLAPRYQIDPQLVLAIIRVESAFNIRAVSQKNAQGLMQLMPETAQRFRVKDTFDPEDNIKGGLSYLQRLLTAFQGNLPLVLAAYNAGERAVANHKGVPPYAETQEYVRKVTLLYGKITHPFPAR